MKRAAAALTLIALGLAGCGGGSKTTSTSTTLPAEVEAPVPHEPTKSVPGTGHECTPGNEALQCVLPEPEAQRFTLPPPGATVTKRGIDFAWGAPSAASAKANYRAQFGASYLSHDPSKGWKQRAGLVNEYHRAGLGTVAVWETSANRAAQGCNAGLADAKEAASQAASLGNTDRPIFFAIDFDASGAQVVGYFNCIHAKLGARTGAYGGYTPLAFLCRYHLISVGWQTYAWSGGRWLPASCAPLEQYLNDGVVDYDRALAADYGQWPGPAVVTKATKRRELARERHLIAARHALIDRHHCRKGAPWYGHASPRRYHTACGKWLKRGARNHRNAARLERELRS